MEKRQTPNELLSAIPRSGIRRLTDPTMGNAFGCEEFIQLGFGQPQEPTDTAIREAIVKAAEQRTIAYTENAGTLELRSAIAAKLKTRNSIEATPEDIFVTPGATYGVAAAIGCLINPGDEVLIPDPGYPNFAPLVRRFGGTVKFYPLLEEKGFMPDFDHLSDQISSSTKVIIINSPSNPTGAVFTANLIERFVKFTAQHKLWLLSDEVYEAYVYNGRHVSPLSFTESDHVVGIYSFSKTYNITGLRVGYLVTRDQALRRAVLNAQELFISCASSISQSAAHHALRNCDDYVESLQRCYREKRDLTMSFLNPYVTQSPEGSFYVLVDIKFTGLTSDQFADQLLHEKKVIVAAGATFGPRSDRYIRVAFTAPTNMLQEGLRRLREFLDGLRRSQSVELGVRASL